MTVELTLQPQLWPHERKRNQSAMHEELTHRALRWFGARSRAYGARGSTEIPIARSYVADAAAFGGINSQFEHGMGLVDKYPRYQFCVVFEAKASRPDFRSTFQPSKAAGPSNRLAAPVAHLHYLVVPKGLLKPDDYKRLEFWGVLEAYGRGLTVKRHAAFQEINDDAIANIMYSLLWYGTFRSQLALHIPTCPECLNDGETPDPRLSRKRPPGANSVGIV